MNACIGILFVIALGAPDELVRFIPPTETGKVGFLTTVDGIPVVGQPALAAARDHGDVPRYLAAGSGVRM